MNISVIIPTYNRASFLEQTINSIQNQTIKPNEIIIIDDGSTDDTKQIIENFDVKYIYQSNSGVSSARNTGIKIAKNDWIAFCDSDDIWDEKKLEKQINFHKSNPNILFSHTDELWQFNDKIIKQKKHQYKPKGKCFVENLSNCKIGASTVLLHKSILDDIGLFDETLIACEDYDLWLRILIKYELGLIEEKLIKKIAGHCGQLSFETPFMDIFRIKALQKHLKSIYCDDVQQELTKKTEIILNGAKKHNNLELIKQMVSKIHLTFDTIIPNYSIEVYKEVNR